MKKILFLGAFVLALSAFGLNQNGQGQNDNNQGQNGQGQNNNNQGQNGPRAVAAPEGTAFEIPLMAGGAGVWLWFRHRAAQKSKSEKSPQ
jgi:hypothetical protein